MTLLHQRSILIVFCLFLMASPASAADPMRDVERPVPSDAIRGLTIHYERRTETLTLTASSVPLRTTLEAITEKTGVVFKLPPGMNPLVDVSLEALPLERAIKNLLKPSRNAAMIYVSQIDPPGRLRYILTEVRILEWDATASGYISPVTAGLSPAGPQGPQAPSLTPEELQARQAEKQARQAEKQARRAENDKAKAEKQAARKGGNKRADVSPGQPPAQPTGDGTAPPAPAPSGRRGRR